MHNQPFQIPNFIGGDFVGPASGQYLENIEPATGKSYSHVADSDFRDVELAVAAADKAFGEWSRTTTSNVRGSFFALPI